MSLPLGLDPDLLRAFTFVAEEGSFTRAARRIGRTQSAVSMQLQRLESALGQRLLLRHKGGAVQLTAHGQYLLARAREVLALNDEIWGTFRAPPISGSVRLGTPDDYALRYLPPILKRFADTHPAVEVEVLCASSTEVVERLRAGELDLTLVSEGNEPPNWPSVPLWRGPLHWITAERFAPHRQDPLPLALAYDHCSWRAAALRALQQAGRHYRIAYTSGSQAGTHAPVMAGLAITVSTISWLPEGLRTMRPDEGMPPLPEFGILLLQGREPRQTVAEALAQAIVAGFKAEAATETRAAV
ncbi:MAG TPA: LysR substrate-binding domain-containing protein [Acetobacteraceae bacterium]|nr:LysR substrate-binding domain-containing protein [Acetobacteraceae bacterium]